jgi:hypothetical protein
VAQIAAAVLAGTAAGALLVVNRLSLADKPYPDGKLAEALARASVPAPGAAAPAEPQVTRPWPESATATISAQGGKGSLVVPCPAAHFIIESKSLVRSRSWSISCRPLP